MSMRTDAELLEAWRGGELAAGRELFDRYIGLVSRFFRNKVGTEAEDLIQRTFLACAEARDRLRDGAAFRTYVLKVARSKLYKHYRDQRSHTDLDAMTVSIADLTASPSAVIAQVAREAALLDALRHLPLELQLVVELHYWEGMSTAELAEVFEVPQGTVKTRLLRARTLVRERMGVARAPDDGEERDDFDAWAQSLRSLLSSAR
jgi:RNA polymerase sigma-70 factor (ECF subfamily)